MIVVVNIVTYSKKEKKDLVIKLAEEGLTTREIAKQVRINLSNIGKILREHKGKKRLTI